MKVYSLFSPKKEGMSAPPNGIPATPAANSIGMLNDKSLKPSTLSPVQYAPYRCDPKKKDLVRRKGRVFSSLLRRPR